MSLRIPGLFSCRIAHISSWIGKSLILAFCPSATVLLDLSTFSDDYCDFTAFVHTYTLYLDVCLESAFLGKLGNLQHCRTNRIANMKLPLILDCIGHLQHHLNRAIATCPTGPAKINCLVQISLYAVVHKGFDLHHGISDGLSLLLSNFFHLERPACCKTFQECSKAANTTLE